MILSLGSKSSNIVLRRGGLPLYHILQPRDVYLKNYSISRFVSPQKMSHGKVVQNYGLMLVSLCGYIGNGFGLCKAWITAV